MKERVFEVVQDSYRANATHPDGCKHYIVIGMAINGEEVDAIRRNEDRPLLSISEVGYIDGEIVERLKEIDKVVNSLEKKYFDLEERAMDMNAKINLFNMRFQHTTWLYKGYIKPLEIARAKRAEILCNIPGYDGRQSIIY